MYDIIFISKFDTVNRLADIRRRFPLAKRATSLQEAQQISLTKMFWAVWDDTVIADNFEFEYHVPEWDQDYIHVFKNGEYFDGICLVPKHASISKRESEYRFFVAKKEVDIVASVPRPFDIVFISYNEPSADSNYKKLLFKAPTAKRIHGVKGIHQAHIEAAKVATSDLFWVVDGDADIVKDFNFEFPQVLHFDTYTKTIVHVWRSRNPINGLEYGYGGVKLLPRLLTLNMDINSTDMTMSISSAFKSMDGVSNVTAFNTDAFSTWRSAFRECVKLATMDTEEAKERLRVWCTVANGDYSDDALRGANAGAKYGQENAADPAALRLINDFTWLKSQWSAETP